MADEPVHLSKQKIGYLSYQTEVSEFNEPGGMMDQYTTAMGNLIYLDPEPEISIIPVGADLGTFVLGDSCEPKNTREILNRCRDSRLKVIQQLKIRNPKLSIRTCYENLDQTDLAPDEKDLFSATIKNGISTRPSTFSICATSSPEMHIGFSTITALPPSSSEMI